jgi:hypothetical protein
MAFKMALRFAAHRNWAIVTLAMAAGMLSLSMGDASAQACRNYAQTAVDQNAENLGLNCGFTGPRWQNDFVRHRNWCRTVGPAARDRETNARNRQLEQCRVAQAPRPPAGGGGRCARYAQEAVDQNAENRRLNCGLRGPRWQNDFVRHRNWCRTVNRAASRNETDARNRQLQQCRVARQPQPQRGRCGRYADNAVEQYRESVALGCGFNNHRWNDNRRAHRNWCRNVNRAQTNSETQRRDNMLRQCRFAQTRTRNCALYADKAMTHVRLNRQLGCGFGGPRWNRNRQAHAAWCRSAPRGVPRSETRAREAMIDECRFARQDLRACRPGERLIDGRCVNFGFSFPLPGGGVLTIR